MKKEKTVIEVLRRHLAQISAEDVQHESYPEEIGVPNSERPCDAIWQGRHERYAVEHTSIDSFHGQRHDDDRFRKLMGSLEKEWSGFPDDWLEISIDVATIPNGVGWRDLSGQIKAWLIDNISSLPFNCETPINIPGVPFDLWIYRERLPGEFGRSRPSNSLIGNFPVGRLAGEPRLLALSGPIEGECRPSDQAI